MSSAMTATLPQEVRDAFGRFVTSEFTTIDARQQPIVWPVTPYYEPGAPNARHHHRAWATRRRPTTPVATRTWLWCRIPGATWARIESA